MKKIVMADVFALCASLGAMSAFASAQCPTCTGQRYDASTGILPGACFQQSGIGSASVTDGELRLSSPIGNPSGISFESSATLNYLWADNLACEARLRVPIGGWGTGPGFRGATFFGGADAQRRVCFVWVWSSGVALSTSSDVLLGEPGMAMMEFDAASEFHTYTLVTNADGAALKIDGTVRLSLPYTSTHPSAQNSFLFGTDSRFSGAVDSFWKYVHLNFSPECHADFDDSGCVDLDDFTAFTSAFESGVDAADFDGSGFVDLDDYTSFVEAFETGC